MIGMSAEDDDNEMIVVEDIVTLDSFRKRGTATGREHNVWQEVWMRQSDESDKHKRQERLDLVDLRWRTNRK